MKKRFLPISLLLTIMVLAQTSFVVNANGDSGKYTPRSASQPTAQSFMKSIRANQETGLIDPAWMLETSETTQTRDEALNWASLGPDNYGSLTRGIIYDKKDATNKTIYIGTMGGGVFKSINGGITWKPVAENMMVSCMVQAENGTIYVGTGDGRGAHNQNGLSVLNYETSFVGNGIYKIENDVITQIENTSIFVNDLAAYGNVVYAATNEGIKKTEDGNTWTTIVEGEAYGIELTSEGSALAVVGYDVLLSNEEGGFDTLTNGTILPASETYKIIAVAPSDPNFAYVSYLKSDNGTGDIYFTDALKNTETAWKVGYTATNMYDIYGKRGLLDNAMTVYPNNPRKLLIGGTNLWVMRDEFGDGIYRLECISSGSGFQIPQSGGAFYYNYSYIHSGIQAITFNPSNINEFFVGSEGGVFKGTCSAANGYQFEGTNRYFIDAENHTSVTRMFSVGFTGKDNKVIGGCLDHGTIYVIGDKSINEEDQAGSAIYPNDISTTNAAETYGAFDYSKAGGPCAISTIDPKIMFVTATGSNGPGTPLLRTQTAGVDYDKDNFSYSVTNETTSIANTDAFRTPIALFENYNDTKAVETTKFYNKGKTELPTGTKVQVESNNCSYPFYYTLTEPLKAGDSIDVQDIISATLLVAVKGKLYMTRDALVFNEVANWWNIGNVNGIPNALTISKDGDVAYVGTVAGKMYRVSGLTDAVTEELALGVEAIQGIDGTDSIPGVQQVITFEELDGTIFNERAITSIAIDPEDANSIIVTLGNYGNTDYVYYSSNGGTSFESVQGNLAAMPVYSSIIETTTGKVILGTEKGIYTSNDMNTWVSAGLNNIPVMEIKQQLQTNHDNEYVNLVDEIGDTLKIEHPGIFNEGMIYAATYGRGLYKCDNYKASNSELSIEETTTSLNVLEMSIYPNPVATEANINFSIESNTYVSLQVFDLSGRLVINEVLGNYGQGSHTAKFNVENLTAGTYIVKVQAGNVSNTSKILVY